MQATDRQVLDAVGRWASHGHRFVLVTVARTWGSAPRPPGSWMALRDDGQVQGSVSGGCIEEDLIARLRAGDFDATLPFVLTYGVTQEEAQRYGLPCGGTMELVVEPQPDPTALAQLAALATEGRLASRTIRIGQPGAALAAVQPDAAFSWDGITLRTVHGPAWRLLLIGAGQIASYLTPMAQALGYQVLVCDPRSEYHGGWEAPHASLLTCMPDDAVMELRLDARSAVVALTHDPKLDDMALLEALKSPAFYVGALGSVLNSEKRRARLREHFDLSAQQVDRLHGPVGLAIGSRTPPEIALAILAHMTAIRNGMPSKV